MTKLTEEAFIQAMRDAVAERGADYVYPPFEDFTDDYHNAAGTCQYQTPDGKPACIVGLALSKIDPVLVPKYGDMRNAREVLYGIGAKGFFASAAELAQEVQDEGGTWGQALERFERNIEAKGNQ